MSWAECRGFESHPGQFKKRKLSWVYIVGLLCLSCKSLSLDYSVIGSLITPVGSFIMSLCSPVYQVKLLCLVYLDSNSAS